MRAERGYSPAARAAEAPDPSRVLVIACGALARELVAVIDQAGLANVDLTCLPATLHNRPGGIPAAVRAKIAAARARYDRIFVAYADCGTGGLLDRMLEIEGVERLPGAHCYEFYSGSAAFEAMTDDDPATFFLTDFLARNFDRLVIQGLGLDRHPELLPAYFGNYHRLIYLAQTQDPALQRAARRAARRLGLAFESRRTGYGNLASSVIGAATSQSAAPPAVGSSTAEIARAANATNVVVGAPAWPQADDSLRVGQAKAGQLARSGQSVPLTQRRDRSRAVRRRSVRSTQRTAERVRQEQRLDAESAAVAGVRSGDRSGVRAGVRAGARAGAR